MVRGFALFNAGTALLPRCFGTWEPLLEVFLVLISPAVDLDGFLLCPRIFFLLLAARFPPAEGVFRETRFCFGKITSPSQPIITLSTGYE